MQQFWLVQIKKFDFGKQENNLKINDIILTRMIINN